MIDDGIAARFWAHVDKSGGPKACWPWTGNLDPAGYGRFCARGERFYTHRLAFQLTYGAVLPGLHICHHCDNPPCCNPKHLFVGTPADNMADRDRKGRGKIQPRTRPIPSQWGSPEHRTKMSASTKTLWADPEFRAKMIAARSTPTAHAKLSAAHRASRRASEAQTRRWSDARRAQFSAAMKQRMNDPETRSRISKALTGRRLTPETRAKMSAAQQRRKAA